MFAPRQTTSRLHVSCVNHEPSNELQDIHKPATECRPCHRRRQALNSCHRLLQIDFPPASQLIHRTKSRRFLPQSLRLTPPPPQLNPGMNFDVDAAQKAPKRRHIHESDLRASSMKSEEKFFRPLLVRILTELRWIISLPIQTYTHVHLRQTVTEVVSRDGEAGGGNRSVRGARAQVPVR